MIEGIFRFKAATASIADSLYHSCQDCMLFVEEVGLVWEGGGLSGPRLT